MGMTFQESAFQDADRFLAPSQAGEIPLSTRESAVLLPQIQQTQ